MSEQCFSSLNFDNNDISVFIMDAVIDDELIKIKVNIATFKRTRIDSTGVYSHRK